MNFYKRYPGDYMRDTAHLSLTEHGAYSALLDVHYSTEKPVVRAPKVYQIVRAISKAEKRAVDSVLDQFWTLTPEGYTNNKAQKEMAKAEARRGVNRENALKGGRPKGVKTKTESDSQSLTESLTEWDSQSDSQSLTEMDSNTRHQTPDTRKRLTCASEVDITTGEVIHWGESK